MTFAEYRRLNQGAPRRLIDDLEVQVIADKAIDLLYCPSDTLHDANFESVQGGAQPAFIDGWGDAFLYFNVKLPMKGTNYAACCGAATGSLSTEVEGAKFDGMFGTRVQKRLPQVTDGASNSIAIGETLGDITTHVRTKMNPWFFAIMCRGRSDLKWMQNDSIRSPGLKTIGDDWFAFQAGFASRHSAGANFAFVDGSVHLVDRAIDLRVFYRLCGIADGEP